LDDEDSNGRVVQVPVLGNVAAGKPLFAEENFDGVVKVPELEIGKGKHFALNIKGDSMQDAGIMSGDIAVINFQNYADNGDIIVAVIDEAVTLKRFFKEKNRVMLKPENKAYPPIYSQNIRILGKLSYLIRKYE